MAARYVRIGQYPDYRDEIRGTLLEILASTANPGTYAAPEDVAGCTLEMGADGLWTGNLGTLTQAQEDALVASGAMASVKVGTPGNIAGTLVCYGGVGVGWVSPNSIAFKDRFQKNALSGLKKIATYPTNSIKKYPKYTPNLDMLDVAWAHVLPTPSGITISNGTINFSAISSNDQRLVGFNGAPYFEPLNRQVTAKISLGDASDVVQISPLNDITNNYKVQIKIRSTGADYTFRGSVTSDTGVLGDYAFGLNPTIRVTINNLLILVELLVGSTWTTVFEKMLNPGVFGNPATNLRSFDWKDYIPSVGIINNVSGNIAISEVVFGASIPVGYRDMQFVRNSDGSVYLDGEHVYMTATTGIKSTQAYFPGSNCVVLRMNKSLSEIEEVAEIFTSYPGDLPEHSGDTPIFIMRNGDEWVWYASSFGYSGSNGRNLGPGIYWGRTKIDILNGVNVLPIGSWFIPPGPSNTANYDANVVFANDAWHIVWTVGYGTSIAYCTSPTLDGLVAAAMSPSSVATGGEGPKIKIDESGNIWAVEASTTGDVKVFSIADGIIHPEEIVANLSGFKAPHLDVVRIKSDFGVIVRCLTFDYTEFPALGAYSHGKIHLIGT